LVKEGCTFALLLNMKPWNLLRSVRLRVSRPRSGIPYWQERVRQFGARAVLNTGHSAAEIDRVTERQWNLLEPLLRAQLRGDESRALDFGCGYGRFTTRIAAAIGGTALGVDPIAALLAMTTRSANVSYALLGEEGIPARNCSFDVVWICLVLGSIVDEKKCRRVIAETRRVLAPGGLLFVVENTADLKSPSYARFRPAATYASMFKPVPLAVIGEYEDLGERISVLAGRA
jgi:SAM-dependent methyltransferase